MSRRSAETVAICVVIASDGLYYAIFGLILLFAAFGLALVSRRGRGPVLGAAVACVLVGAVLAIDLAPTFVYQARHGTDPQVSRSPQAGDDLALSVSYLILPPNNGRLVPLRAITSHYAGTLRGCPTASSATPRPGCPGTPACSGWSWSPPARCSQRRGCCAAGRTAVLSPLRLTCAPGALTIENPTRATHHADLRASRSQPVTVGRSSVMPRGGTISLALVLPPGRTRLALAGPPGAELTAPAVIDSAFAPFSQRGGPTRLTGIVGPPCAHVAL